MVTFVTFSMIIGEEEGEDDSTVPVTQPVDINPVHIRSFRARSNNAPGTRIEFPNSAAIRVTQTVAEVRALLASHMTASQAAGALPR